VGPIDPRGGSAEQLPAHQPIGVVRRPFKEPPLTAESGGRPGPRRWRWRAHRGTGSSNPVPSSEGSANFRFPEHRDQRAQQLAPTSRRVDTARGPTGSVVDAVRCAVEIQRGMAEREPEGPGS
jgi:hypothetical protein